MISIINYPHLTTLIAGSVEKSCHHVPSQLLHEPVDGLRVHRFAVDQRAAPAPGSAGAGEGGDEHDLGLLSVPEMLETLGGWWI